MPQFSLRTLAAFTALICGSLAIVRFPTPAAAEALQLVWPALLILAACLAIGCRGALRSLYVGYLIATVGAFYWDDAQRATHSVIPAFSRTLAESLERYLLHGYVPAYDGLTTFSLDADDPQLVHFVKKDKQGAILEQGVLPLWRVRNYGINQSVLPVQPDRVSYFAAMKMTLILWIGAAGATIAFYADKASRRRGERKPSRKKKDPPDGAGLA